MNFNTTFAGIAAGIALVGTVGVATAQEKNTDPRICAQPFAGQLIQVSCANIAGIIESQGWVNKVSFVPTKDGEDGEQFNQVNDTSGKPILFIYTPPSSSSCPNTKES